MVPKKNGDWRPCSNYRSLNAQTVPDRYPIPHIQDFTQRLAGARVSLKTDLVWVYYQIPVEPIDVHNTAGLDFVFVYLDDLLVTSVDHKMHKTHLQIVFTCLAEYGVIIGPEKCQFGTTALSFLGHHVCPDGISPSPSAVEVIVNFVKPESKEHCEDISEW